MTTCINNYQKYLFFTLIFKKNIIHIQFVKFISKHIVVSKGLFVRALFVATCSPQFVSRPVSKTFSMNIHATKMYYVKNITNISYGGYFQENLKITCVPRKNNYTCHFVMIHRLTHNSHNSSFDQCFTSRALNDFVHPLMEQMQ